MIDAISTCDILETLKFENHGPFAQERGDSLARTVLNSMSPAPTLSLSAQRFTPRGGHVEAGAKADSEGTGEATVSGSYTSDDGKSSGEVSASVNSDGKVTVEGKISYDF